MAAGAFRRMRARALFRLLRCVAHLRILAHTAYPFNSRSNARVISLTRTGRDSNTAPAAPIRQRATPDSYATVGLAATIL
jgi:hypothetical protein